MYSASFNNAISHSVIPVPVVGARPMTGSGALPFLVRVIVVGNYYPFHILLQPGGVPCI